jgi:hypothetical protein
MSGTAKDGTPMDPEDICMICFNGEVEEGNDILFCE